MPKPDVVVRLETLKQHQFATLGGYILAPKRPKSVRKQTPTK